MLRWALVALFLWSGAVWAQGYAIRGDHLAVDSQATGRRGILPAALWRFPHKEQCNLILWRRIPMRWKISSSTSSAIRRVARVPMT